MPWFEPPLLAVLRHEYAASMRFAEDDAAEVMPAAPATACQLYVHVPFCETLCPFCSFHRVRVNPAKTGRYFDALRREIGLYHDAGFRFADVYVGGGTPTVDSEQLLQTLACIGARSPVRSQPSARTGSGSSSSTTPPSRRCTWVSSTSRSHCTS